MSLATKVPSSNIVGSLNMLKSSLSPLFICPVSRVLRVLFISLMSCIAPWLKVISATGGGPSLLDAGGPPALPRLEAAGPLPTIALDSLLTNGSSESTSIMSSRAEAADLSTTSSGDIPSLSAISSTCSIMESIPLLATSFRVSACSANSSNIVSCPAIC